MEIEMEMRFRIMKERLKKWRVKLI